DRRRLKACSRSDLRPPTGFHDAVTLRPFDFAVVDDGNAHARDVVIRHSAGKPHRRGMTFEDDGVQQTGFDTTYPVRVRGSRGRGSDAEHQKQRPETRKRPFTSHRTSMRLSTL